MNESYGHLSGQLEPWPPKTELVWLLREAGLRVHEGRHSVRVENCEHFSFECYGGDLGDPTIDADASSVAAMLRDGRLVSAALARAELRHRFEIYDEENRPRGYLHHGWPAETEP